MAKGKAAQTKKGKYTILVYDKVVGQKTKTLQKTPANSIKFVHNLVL